MNGWGSAWRLGACLGLASALLACSESAPRAGSQARVSTPPAVVHVHMISRELSQEIGERTYAELIELLTLQERLDTHAGDKRRLDAIAKRLVRQAVVAYPFSKEWSWELNIVKDDDINASCMPGGKMTVNTGLLALARSDEHKLATVLGHEIAHALLEHGRASIGRSVATQGALTVVAQSFKMGQLRLNTLLEGVGTVTLPLEREHEREADLLGMQLMARAGFDPVRGAAIWAAMQDAQPAPLLAQRLELYLSSHPSGSERLVTLTEIARQLAATPPAAR